MKTLVENFLNLIEFCFDCLFGIFYFLWWFLIFLFFFTMYIVDLVTSGFECWYDYLLFWLFFCFFGGGLVFFIVRLMKCIIIYILKMIGFKITESYKRKTTYIKTNEQELSIHEQEVLEFKVSQHWFGRLRKIEYNVVEYNETKYFTDLEIVFLSIVFWEFLIVLGVIIFGFILPYIMR